MWFDKLKQMKENSGFTTREIALRSKIPEPTLEKLFSGSTKDPRLATIQQLVHFLGYTLDDLDDSPLADKRAARLESFPISDKEIAYIKKYRSLDHYGKDAVSALLDCEYRRCKDQPEANMDVIPFRRSVQPASAGTGM